MGLRRIVAVLALTGAAIFGTAAAAGAVDYPPTTVTVVTQAVPTTQAPAHAAGSQGLPFTGSDTTELFVIGAAIAAAGTLVLVRSHRGNRPGHRDA